MIKLAGLSNPNNPSARIFLKVTGDHKLRYDFIEWPKY